VKRLVTDLLTDLRGITSLTMTLFGLLLLGEALFSTTAADLARTGGLRLNLWTGIALLVVGALFAVAALRSRSGDE
jgi:hypothetical protein